MNHQAMLDKALTLIDLHLDQLTVDATKPTKEGLPRGLSGQDSQVIERYTKLLITITKPAKNEDLSDLSDEELQAVLNGTEDNVPTEMGDTD